MLLPLVLLGCGFVPNQSYQEVAATYDQDGDGFIGVSRGGDDCDDLNATVFPGAAEVCDALDNDCNDQVDEAGGFAVFADVDGDGYGDANAPASICPGITGFVDNARDCDDQDAGINPEAMETCNGQDDDCDGLIDNGPGVPWWPDLDADGFGDDLVPSIQACQAPVPGWVQLAGDCSDTDPTIHPDGVEVCNGQDDDCDGRTDDQDDDVADPSEWFADVDQDGVGGPLSVQSCVAPSSHVSATGDCDDGDPTIPAAIEICNGRDDDCNGSIDDNAADAFTSWLDADEDGVGDPLQPALACTRPDDHVLNDLDCDDTNALIRPGVLETCDGVDEDCDGQIDDNPAGAPLWFADVDVDGHGDPAVALAACVQPPGHAPLPDDCDDTNAAIKPGASETCNTLDDDCDGLVDDLDPDRTGGTDWFQDVDLDGIGAGFAVPACVAPTNHVASSDDCDDTRADVLPGAPELCNGRDDDCDGTLDVAALDEDLFYLDADADGYGELTLTLSACQVPPGYADDAGDCDDGEPLANPDAVEVCDGIDNDCNQVTDDADPLLVEVPTWWRDGDLDGYGGNILSVEQCTAPPDFAPESDDCNDGDPSVNPEADEVCDGIDNDCVNGPDVSALDAKTFHPDNDGDGVPDLDITITSCVQPAGTLSDLGLPDDCNDEDAAIYPSAPDRCDLVDTNCDGTIEETRVPLDHAEIQDAIDASVDGDFICVDDGTYGPITWTGTSLRLASVNGSAATIIDAAGGPNIASIISVPSTASMTGFGLRGSTGAFWTGLFLNNTHAQFTDLEIYDVHLTNPNGSCQAGGLGTIDSDAVFQGLDIHDITTDCAGEFPAGIYGGAAYLLRGTPTFRNTVVHHNTCVGNALPSRFFQVAGCAAFINGAGPTLTNFAIHDNTIDLDKGDAAADADVFGAMLHVRWTPGAQGSTQLFNGVIANNLVQSEGRIWGIVDFYGADVLMMTNVDLYANSMVAPGGAQNVLHNTTGDQYLIQYTNIFGNSPGDTVQAPGPGNGVDFTEGVGGNTRIDPQYVDPANGDYRLQPTSPFLDAGSPAFLDVDGSRSDVGVCGGLFKPAVCID